MKIVTIQNKFKFNSHVLIELTKRCNFFCRHCFTDAGYEMKNELSVEDFIFLIEGLNKFGFKTFTISGGEPTLKRHFEKLLDHNFPKKIKMYLFTNGAGLDNSLLKRIKKKFSGIIVSVDGNEESHDWLRKKFGAYKAILKLIKRISLGQIPLSFQTMVTPQTIGLLDQVGKIARVYNVKLVRLSHADRLGRAKKEKSIQIAPRDYPIIVDKAKSLTRKYKLPFITNLISRKKIIKNPKLFQIPALHILPNGTILPWYGIPEQCALGRFTKDNLDSIFSEDKLKNSYKRIQEIFKMTIKSVLQLPYKVVSLDNEVINLF